MADFLFEPKELSKRGAACQEAGTYTFACSCYPWTFRYHWDTTSIFFAYCNKGEKLTVVFHGYGILKTCFIKSDLLQVELMSLWLGMCNANRICDAMPTELSVVLWFLRLTKMMIYFRLLTFIYLVNEITIWRAMTELKSETEFKRQTIPPPHTQTHKVANCIFFPCGESHQFHLCFLEIVKSDKAAIFHH